MTSSASHLRAVLLALAGYTFWVGGDTFMKLLGELGTPKREVMAIAAFAGMLSIFIISALRGRIAKLRPKKFAVLNFLGLLFLLNYLIFLTALARLPIANFYTILFLAPTVGAIVAAVFLHEHLNIQKILAIIAGFIGVVIAINPTHLFDNPDDWLAYGAAFAGMIVIVTQMVILRWLGDRESRESTAFYPRIFSIIGGAIGILVMGFEPLSMREVLYCFGVGGVGSLGWLCMAEAYKLAPAAKVMPFHYSQIITGDLVGYCIWHDVPTLHLLLGASVIIISGLYIATHGQRSAQLAKTLVDTP